MSFHALQKRKKEYEGLIPWLMTLARPYGIHDVSLLDTSDICVAHWVGLKCKYGCKRYGTSWCCPPETPDPEQMEAVLKEYERAVLLSSRIINGHFYQDNSTKRRAQVRAWKGTVALERELFLAGYYKAFGLVSETCILCKQCTYPNECLFPEFRRPSVESCSIDVMTTLKKAGKSFYIAHDVKEEYTSYSIILLE